MRRVVVLALLVACGDDVVPPSSPLHSNIAAIVDGHVELIDTATKERGVVPEVVDATYVAWSHDGSRLATVTAAGDLRVLDVATGSFVMTVSGVWQKQPLWSPDDARLLVRGDIVSPEGELIDLPGTAIDLAWSPGGHVVQYPDLITGKHCLSCTVDGVCVDKACNALSLEGDVFAVARKAGNNSHTAVDYLWATDDQLLGTIDCSSQTIGQQNDYSWSSRSIHVVGCPYDGAMEFFDATTNTVTSVAAADRSERVLAWSPDGDYLATSLKLVRMADRSTTPFATPPVTKIVAATWSTNSRYGIVWTMPDTGSDILEWNDWIFGPAGAMTKLDSGAAPELASATVFSPSGDYFAITGRVCDPTAFTCISAGEGQLTWLDDDRYFMLRPDGSLVLIDRATGVSDDVAMNATAVDVRPR